MGDKANSYPERTQLALPEGTLERIATAAAAEGLGKGAFMRRAVLIQLNESEQRLNTTKGSNNE
jgi:hypothetical protein